MYPNPWSIQLETTEGCNRRCSFCGIHSLYREKTDVKYRFMTVETAKALAKDMSKWLPKIRLEFALQGEPLLNKDISSIFNQFRTYFPKSQIMMTSNVDVLRKGSTFNYEKILNLFNNGLNILVADYYPENNVSYTEFYNGLEQAAEVIQTPIYDFYKEENKDHSKIWSYQSPLLRKIVVIDNTFDRNINRTLNNQAGNTDPDLIPAGELKKINKELPKQTRCHQPFREMSIKHDGAIPICCMDWQREHIMGKFPEDGSLKDIWNNYHFKLVRDILYNKRRDLLSPCDRCNYHGYKVGLLQGVTISSNAALEDRAKKVKDIQMNEMSKYFNRYAKDPFIYS